MRSQTAIILIPDQAHTVAEVHDENYVAHAKDSHSEFGDHGDVCGLRLHFHLETLNSNTISHTTLTTVQMQPDKQVRHRIHTMKDASAVQYQ